MKVIKLKFLGADFSNNAVFNDSELNIYLAKATDDWRRLTKLEIIRSIGDVCNIIPVSPRKDIVGRLLVVDDYGKPLLGGESLTLKIENVNLDLLDWQRKQLVDLVSSVTDKSHVSALGGIISMLDWWSDKRHKTEGENK